MTTSVSQPSPRGFNWQPQKPAGELVARLVGKFFDSIPFLEKFKLALLRNTGTRLVDWVDHLNIEFSAYPNLQEELEECGFQRMTGLKNEVHVHPGALFPAIVNSHDGTNRVGIKVESVVDFLTAHQIQTVVNGAPGAACRTAKICGDEEKHEAWIIERHGVRCWETAEPPSSGSSAIPMIHESFMTRHRNGSTNKEGFQVAAALIDDSIAKIGVHRTCDLFFKTERHYWQIRNRAGRMQKSRQDSLGMGWENHDHHTYRSSRESFTDLIAILEKLGFSCRERFYAGAEAGWGAQVLEQPNCGIVVFADVDLSQDELAGDFAHEGLSSKEELGTIGLWCALHGEAFLQAGLHHLECQFDYAEARKVLKMDGIGSMDPFTDFDYLKQCFTLPEIWPVEESRIQSLVAQSLISESQATEFRSKGAVGSHLEILQRSDGFKGFNQSGVSKIISKTDPRKMVQN